MHEALPKQLIAFVGEGGGLKKLVRLILRSVPEVVVNRLNRGRLRISGTPPHICSLIHGLIGMILNSVNLRVLDIWPVFTDGLVVSFVCGVSMLKSTVLRWQFLGWRFLFNIYVRVICLPRGNCDRARKSAPHYRRYHAV